jgi:hypothetical protein
LTGISGGDEGVNETKREYEWMVEDDEYSTQVMRHIVHLLDIYPDMDSTVMMAALNALAYQVTTESAYTQAISDIEDLVMGQIFKHGDTAGSA